MPRTREKAVKRGRPMRPKAPAPVEMSDHILDQAEALFALHGLHGVTVREVARAASVDPALIHYYFETKQKLFDAVFVRRAVLVNEERMRSMSAYERAAGERMTVDGCVEAFLEPIWRHSTQHDPRWKNYFRLLALVNNTPEWGGAMMTRNFDTVILHLIGMLRKCMPGCEDADLFWCYHFLSGALTLSLSETGRIDKLSGGVCESADMEGILRRMVPFIAAGFRRVCMRERA